MQPVYAYSDQAGLYWNYSASMLKMGHFIASLDNYWISKEDTEFTDLTEIN